MPVFLLFFFFFLSRAQNRATAVGAAKNLLVERGAPGCHVSARWASTGGGGILSRGDRTCFLSFPGPPRSSRTRAEPGNLPPPGGGGGGKWCLARPSDIKPSFGLRGQWLSYFLHSPRTMPDSLIHPRRCERGN